MWLAALAGVVCRRDAFLEETRLDGIPAQGRADYVARMLNKGAAFWPNRKALA